MPERPSSWLKIDRADQHYEALSGELRAFAETQPYRAVHAHSDDFTSHWLAVDFDRPGDFVQWGLLFGDCVHNLRSALDHLVYEVASHESESDPPPAWRSLMFPVFASEPAFDRSGAWRIETLSPGAQEIIRRQQPYSRSGPTDRTFMLRLHESDIEDKHRQLRIVAMALNVGQAVMKGIQGGESIGIERFDGPLSPGTPFFRLVFPAPRPEMEFEDPSVSLRVALQARFSDGDDNEWLSPLSVLRGFRGAVIRTLELLGPYAGHPTLDELRNSP